MGAQIFYDQSGRRWKRIQVSIFLLIVSTVTSFALLLPTIFKNVAVQQYPQLGDVSAVSLPRAEPSTKLPAEIAYAVEQDDIQVIGEGPLLRVTKIQETDKGAYLFDVYTGRATRYVDSSERPTVQDDQLIIERYGKIYGKQMILTFDDGPDPTFTPPILDLLAQEGALSSFFALGSSVTKHPKLSRRVVSEGHLLANHTFTHADLDLISRKQAEEEINQTQRIIRAVTNKNPSFFRIPYGGNDDDSLRDDLRAILEAQRLGYVVTSYDFDSNDWGFTADQQPILPEFDGMGKVILLHDGGGDRSETIIYLRELIAKAKAAGYTFASLEHLYQSTAGLVQPADNSFADQASYLASSAILVWPRSAVHLIFFISVSLIFLSTFVNIILAILQMRRFHPKRRKPGYEPFVSVVIPAYNEELVLRKAVLAVLKSYYRNLEVIVINDGSTDNTQSVADGLLALKRVRVFHKPNTGKPDSVNTGIRQARGDIIISMDADTVFSPTAIGRLVRHFADPAIGAIAGSVKVGNIRNFITRWQALEYITSINLERTAQAYLGAIMIVPGACSAWRKAAVETAGGYSDDTLAEDCDLTLQLRKQGYRIEQDLTVEAYTESPMTLRSLAKQRFRWTFGNLQSMWKHRDMLFKKKYGWLGRFIMPKSILSILMQIIFAPLLLVVALGNVATGQLKVVMTYFVINYIILFLGMLVALMFAHERVSHMSALPLYRVIYSPLRTFLLYSSLLTALRGLQVGWNKVVRTDTVTSYEHSALEHIKQ